MDMQREDLDMKPGNAEGSFRMNIWTWSMAMKAWTWSMALKAWTCSIGMQNGHIKWTFSMNKQHGHAAFYSYIFLYIFFLIYSMFMRNDHAA
jgi:hypothetical protein